jgi:outer membrane lipoprotein-sorting protein
MNTLLAALSLLSIAQKPDESPGNIDPAAKRVLDSMVKAYRDIRRLDQETTYHRSSDAASGLIRSRLAIQRPNRLFLELVQKSPERPAPDLSRFVCDGKSFYAYQEKNGWFTTEKAPKDLKEFDFLALSVELAALTGNDPIKGLARQARSVRLAVPETADGETTDVVVFDTGSASQTGELKLYVSQADHLLRRFTLENKTIVAAVTGSDAAPEESTPGTPAASVFSYDVHVLRGREQTKDAFAWIPPTGAFPYQHFPNAFDRNLPKSGSADAKAGMPAGVTPMKVYSIQDLIKNGKEAEKKRKKR